MKMRFILFYCVFFGMSVWSLSACSTLKQEPPANDSFQLIIFKQGWYDLELGYSAEDALPEINSLTDDEILFEIGLDDVEWYSWELQTITLTEEATENLAVALDEYDETSEAVEALMGMRESLGWGNEMERLLYTKTFMVSVEGKPLYSGIFLHDISQMAINYPVIRLFMVQEKAVFSILPVHIPFVMFDPIDSSGNHRDIELSVDASQKVVEWTFENATTDTANEFRELIRDRRVKMIFDSVGKLVE